EVAVASGNTSSMTDRAGGPPGWVKRYDAETGKERGSFAIEDENVLRLAFSPDGKSLMVRLGPYYVDETSGRANEIRIWDTRTGEVRLKISDENTHHLMGICFSPDSRMIATCGYDTTLRLWDAEDGHERAVFRGHRNATGFVAFSLDGLRV